MHYTYSLIKHKKTGHHIYYQNKLIKKIGAIHLYCGGETTYIYVGNN